MGQVLLIHVCACITTFRLTHLPHSLSHPHRESTMYDLAHTIWLPIRTMSRTSIGACDVMTHRYAIPFRAVGHELPTYTHLSSTRSPGLQPPTFQHVLGSLDVYAHVYTTCSTLWVRAYPISMLYIFPVFHYVHIYNLCTYLHMYNVYTTICFYFFVGGGQDSELTLL